MLSFSDEGLCELQRIVNQVLPILQPDDAIELFSLSTSVDSKRTISLKDYQKIVDLIEPYTLRHKRCYLAKLEVNEHNHTNVSAAAEQLDLIWLYLKSFMDISAFANEVQGKQNTQDSSYAMEVDV